jgi:P27 family predicted phage terminase small subunit
MQGRKRKSSAVRLAEGNPGHRPIPAEVAFPQGPMRCPTWLTKEARKEWKRITDALADMDLFRLPDRAVLSSYCQAYSRWKEAEETISIEGPVIKVTGHNGQERVIRNPSLAIAEQAQKQMLRSAALCGFTPADRSKVSAPPKQAINPFTATLDDPSDDE